RWGSTGRRSATTIRSGAALSTCRFPSRTSTDRLTSCGARPPLAPFPYSSRSGISAALAECETEACDLFHAGKVPILGVLVGGLMVVLRLILAQTIHLCFRTG